MAHVRRGDHRPELRNMFTADGVLPGTRPYTTHSYCCM